MNLPLQLGILDSANTLIIAFVVLVIIIWILSSSIKIVKEYERAVIFRLGRLLGAKGPGLFLIIPFVDAFRKVDLRVLTFDVPKQVVITRDNITISVDAVVYYRVFDPNKAITQVENFVLSTNLLAQTMLRDILGQVELDEILAKREELNKKLQQSLDVATDPWGIKVTAVVIKDVTIPESLQRAIAKQAEAERERRSRIIIAEGEQQAAQKMLEAAELYSRAPIAMRLREFQMITEVAREKNLVVISSSGSSDVANIAGIAKAVQEKK